MYIQLFVSHYGILPLVLYQISQWYRLSLAHSSLDYVGDCWHIALKQFDGLLYHISLLGYYDQLFSEEKKPNNRFQPTWLRSRIFGNVRFDEECGRMILVLHTQPGS